MVHLPRLVASALVLAVAGSSGGQGQTSEPKVVHVTAERFAFSPAEITVDQGTVLELRLTSEDTNHGFKLVGPDGPTGINVEIPKRGRGDIRVVFDAKQEGTFIFECSHLCGAGHGFMRGSIKVKARSGS